MVDFINKLIKFTKTNIIARPFLYLYKSENTQVLLSEDIKNRKKYSIKITFSQMNNSYQISSINTEILLLQKMKNEDNIVKIIDFTTITQYNFIFYLLLMEYCEYKSLYDILKDNYNNGKKLSSSLIYSYIYQIALGLKSIHKNGYCHRDLSPENILFKEKEKLVICDFGSATNQFYTSLKNNINNINNNIFLNNILFEISNKTSFFYRAPEEISIFSDYPLNEKVDIYALGLILFSMLLSYIPSLNDKNSYFFFLTSKKIKNEVLQEIKSFCNPCFYELIENTLAVDPNKRFNIDEVITFLIAKESQISLDEDKFKIDLTIFDQYFDLTINNYEKEEINKKNYNISILVKKLLQNEKNETISDIPNNFYIDKLIEKINNKPNKITKFYKIFFNSNIFFDNVFSIKMIYIVHYFIYNFNQETNDNNIFINKIEIISPKDFDIEALFQMIINYYNLKINNNYYDKDEIIKNIQVNKFILLYCQFMKNKIILLKKYSSIISNDNTLNVTDINKILSLNFIYDIFNLFLLSYQLLLSIPFNINILIPIFDLIAFLLNQEIVFLSSILFNQIIALLKMNRQIKFLGQFIDIIIKTNFFFQKLKMFRKQIGSKNKIIYYINCNNQDIKLKELINYISNIKFDENFNVNEFFNVESNIRKELNYIPIKIAAYKNDLHIINNKLFNEKNNIKELIKKNNENKINNKNNNIDIFSDLNKEIQNININKNNINIKKINKNININKSNINNNNIIFNKKNNNKNSNNNSNKNSNKNSRNNSNKKNNNNSNNKNSNSSNTKNSNNSNNDDFMNFNKCFFDNEKENNEEQNNCDNKNQGMVSDISSNLNILSYMNSNINNNSNNKISEVKKCSQIDEGNSTSNIQQILNPSTRVSSNFPGDSNAISNTIINNNNEHNNINIKGENKKKITNNINNNIIINNNQNNKKEETKDKLCVVEEILSFLKYEFSKPIFQFIIQQNSIKTFNLIGYGGTSEVYLGNYRGTDVAIKKIKVKKINDNYFKEFKNEIVALTMIRHPNLVIFMGTMIENNNLCIVTEYCKGGTLFDLLYKKKNIEIPWNIRLKILIDISKAMNFLHTNNPQIIHYDLKSLNILMTDDIRENSDNNNVTVKINDFGLSKIIDKEKIEREDLQGVVGSVQWMAPEVIQNNCRDNTKADVYSFGIIIWEVCTRIQPYKDMSILQIINFVCNENKRPDCGLLPLEQMPKGLLELIENCWNTDPNLRPDFSSVLFTLTNMQSLDE